MSLFTSMSVTQVAGTRRTRRGFAGWKAAEIQVAHNNVGGVTTQKEQLQGFSKTKNLFEVSGLPYVVGRDASTVLYHGGN
jgi:hypothetical protein